MPASSASTSYTANALNQYSAVGAVTPSYDANGILTFDGSFTYCYDAESRLTAVLSAGSCASPGTTVASYAYDPLGRRKSRTTGGATTVYVAGAGGNDILEYNGGSGAPQRWYAYGPNAVVNRMDLGAGTRATLVRDAQGSVVASLDSGSGAMTRWGYRPYGENPSLTTDSFAYTGQRHDPETSGSAAEPSGLYDYHARMYSPTLGRFLQPDPAGSAGSGGNLYAYVGGDPINLSDPSGMLAEDLKSFGNKEVEGFNNDVAYGGFLARQSGLDRVYNDIYGLQLQAARGDPLGALGNIGNGLGFLGTGGGFLSADARTAKEIAPTIGDLLKGLHPDTMVHLTPSLASEFAGGVNTGSYFARLGDVAHLTLNEYRSLVVGPLAAGFEANATTLLHVGPEQLSAFRAEVPGLNGFSEYTNMMPVIPRGFVTVPPWEPVYPWN